MGLQHRIELERLYHESEDKLRDQNSLIVGVYQSGVFDEVENYHLNVLGDISGLHVLDYGCGTGGSSRRLREMGARVTGFDISMARLQEARLVLSASGAKSVDLTLCAAEHIPFADGTFDAVFGKQILHHLELDVAISEIARVLKPGGRAVFLEPLIHNPILEGYRRLTPHLRSPTERALSMGDLERIGANFSHWQHKEFCLLAVLPALLEAKMGKHTSLTRSRSWLQKVDRALMKAMPFIGRYAWETVITLER